MEGRRATLESLEHNLVEEDASLIKGAPPRITPLLRKTQYLWTQLDAEIRYTRMEKLVYALILAARYLRPYFQANGIEVKTFYPLRQIFHKPESFGRMLKCVIELRQFHLEFTPRTTIKG